MQSSLFPGLTTGFDLKKINETIQHCGHAHSCRSKQRIQPGIMEGVISSRIAYDIHHETKRIQAGRKMNYHRMEPMPAPSTL